VLSKRILYIQVYPDHLFGRVVGEDKRARRDCLALDNRRAELKDFTRIRRALRSLIKELTPGFSLRKPTALMHFLPEHYQPTRKELEQFKLAAERSGISFCWMSQWETPHTDSELQSVAGAL
jgi:nitroreductase